MNYEKLLNLFTLKGDVHRPQFAKPNKANGTVHATDAEALIFFDENLASNIETNSKYPDIRMVVPDSNCNTIMNMESLTVLLSKPIKELKGKYLNLGERFIEAKNLHKLVKVHKALKEKVFMVYDSDHINRPFVFEVGEVTVVLVQVVGEMNSEHHIGEYERLS